MVKFLTKLLCTTSTIFSNSSYSATTTSVIIEYYMKFFSLKLRYQHQGKMVIILLQQFLSLFLIMEKLRETFQRAWRGVIAPNRYQYNINSVCPKEQLIDNHLLQRIDFTVPRDDGSNISAVILREKHKPVRDAILYFHGNGGSKIEIMGVLPLIAEHSIAVISFDFVGCGNSDNGYLTYGLNESADAETVLRQAYKYLQIERLTVWGRSMGAVTAIMFAAKNHKIVDKLVLDSPFRSLEEVVRRVVAKQTSLPQPLITLVLYFLKRQIEERLSLPLFSEDYMQHFRKIPKTVSILLICSENDSIVPKQEVEEFYKVFKGNKELLEIEQGHEQDRGVRVYGEVVRWVRRQKSRKNMKLRLFRPQQCYQCEKEQVYTIC